MAQVTRIVSYSVDDVVQPDISLTFEDTYEGVCEWCRGTGCDFSYWSGWTKAHGNAKSCCSECNGTGIATCADHDYDDIECNGGVHLGNGHRCTAHTDAYNDRQYAFRQRANEYLSDTPPDWFDESYAGERWSDDY